MMNPVAVSAWLAGADISDRAAVAAAAKSSVTILRRFSMFILTPLARQ
jgi:hypothetical protein